MTDPACCRSEMSNITVSNISTALTRVSEVMKEEREHMTVDEILVLCHTSLPGDIREC